MKFLIWNTVYDENIGPHIFTYMDYVLTAPLRNPCSSM